MWAHARLFFLLFKSKKNRDVYSTLYTVYVWSSMCVWEPKSVRSNRAKSNAASKFASCCLFSIFSTSVVCYCSLKANSPLNYYAIYLFNFFNQLKVVVAISVRTKQHTKYYFLFLYSCWILEVFERERAFSSALLFLRANSLLLNCYYYYFYSYCYLSKTKQNSITV